MMPVAVFLLGLVIGSFLNVCIARLPLQQSVVAPGSRCPRCSAAIRWYDNIPVVSFILLRGRCRNCGLPISLRYPVVELLNGLLYLWVLSLFGPTGEALLLMAFCSALIVITFIDLDHQIIPDAITLPGMAAGLVLAPFLMSALQSPLPSLLERIAPADAEYVRALLHSVLGLLAGAAPLWLIGWAWEKVKHVEAMGGGDIKLMGMVGSLLGWQGALMTIMLGATSGAVIGGALVLLKKHDADNVIPFGPFLAAGALVAAFHGNDILTWYVGLLRP